MVFIRTIFLQKKQRGDQKLFLVTPLVRMARLELAQENSHHPLKVARLPFRHIRIILDCKDR